MGWRCRCVIIVLLLLPLMASSGSIVKNLPGYNGDLPFKLETGYIGVGEAEEVQLFYLFVESQRSPSVDPLLLWFVGGPGCSGLSAFFFENGPLVMDRNYSGNLPKLEWNPNSWTRVLNMIYIDLPVGTGFSYSETQEGYYSSDMLWVEHTYTFLQKWFIDHPKFASNPFYIGGGSYSGLVTGPLVQKVYEGRIARQKPLININSLKESCDGDYVNIDPENTECVSNYEAYSELVRYINKQQILEPLCVTTPGVNQGILQPVQDRSAFWCRSYDHILIDIWANDESVWKALHIREGTKEEFARCNKTLAYTVRLYNVVEYYRNLTNANLQALIYCSDLDMSIPHLGTQYWIKTLNLSIHDKWRAWFVEGQVAGYTEIYKMKPDHYLTYVTVKGAGHVAQTFKPKEVYHMIERWFSFSLI